MAFDERAYKNKFNRQTYKNYSFRLHIDKDKELIEFLDSIRDKKTFFKDLVEIAKNNEKKGLPLKNEK